ncbi:SycD/LcrH family type III secretion system chaperone [Pseudomonas sp. HK3]|jgi:type III secretion system low calcium response chaperone LcrH/SycD
MAQTAATIDNLPENFAEEELGRILSGISQDGRTIQEMKGINTEQMEALYGIAYNYYSAEKLEDAIRTFSMLAMLNPYESKYWKGLGASLQVNKAYEKAAEAYGMAATTAGIHDPTPHFHAGECYTHLKLVKDACIAFEMACDLSQGKPEFAWVANKSKAILNTFNEFQAAV